jgi:sugar lactone lactonase YvrE
MYMTDSFSSQIDVINFDSVDGEIYNRRKFVEVRAAAYPPRAHGAAGSSSASMKLQHRFWPQ